MGYKWETFIALKSLRLEGQGQGAAWSGEGPGPGLSLLALSSCGGRGKGALWTSLRWALTLPMRAPLMTSAPPKESTYNGRIKWKTALDKKVVITGQF